MSHLIRIFPVCLVNLFFIPIFEICPNLAVCPIYPTLPYNHSTQLEGWKGRPYQSVHKGAAAITQLRTCTIKTVHIKVKVRKKARSRIHTIHTIKYHPWPRTPYEKVTKTKENITYKRAKRSALSQQVTTSLQGTDKLV